MKQETHTGLHKAPDTSGLVDLLHNALSFCWAQEHIRNGLQVVYTGFYKLFVYESTVEFHHLTYNEFNYMGLTSMMKGKIHIRAGGCARVPILRAPLNALGSASVLRGLSLSLSLDLVRSQYLKK